MVKSKDQKNKRKGKFLCPEIYRFAKSSNKEFINKSNNPYLNIRSSSYLERFSDCVFKIHTGKSFISNYPLDLKVVFKDYPFYDFKLGQFSYNKQIINRGEKNVAAKIIAQDLKRKKGTYIKNNKKKKYIYKRA